MKTGVQERIEQLVTNGLNYSEPHDSAYPDSALSLQMKLCKMEGEEWVKAKELHPLLESLGFSWQRFLVVQPVGMHKTICSMKKQGYEVEVAPAFTMGRNPKYLKGMLSVYKRTNK
ncbi:MAG: hypothetical protein V1734_01915 [Nanoarchaeota archaeon]